MENITERGVWGHRDLVHQGEEPGIWAVARVCQAVSEGHPGEGL